MITIHFYNAETGEIRESPLCASRVTDKFISMNTPRGHKAVFGVKDPKCQLVDIETGALIARKSVAAVADPLARSRRVAKRKILQLEAMQPRALREAALNRPGGNARLAAIDAEIAELRLIINS